MCVLIHGYGGLGGKGMVVVVDCMHAGQDQGVGHMAGDAEVRGDTLMTDDHTAIQVRSSELGRAGIGRYSRKRLKMGRHENVPVCCPCSRLATLHGAPRTCCSGYPDTTSDTR